MKSIVVWTRKGGVGKTTLATHLAWYCADAKRRVLVIDLDAQGNASDALATADRIGEAASLFQQGASLPLDAPPTGPLALFAGTERLIDVERQEAARVTAAFREHYGRLATHFDVVIVDGPAGQTLPLMAALLCANFGVAPLDLGQWSVNGVEATLRTYVGMRQRYNPGLQFLGMVPFRVDNRLASNRAALKGIAQAYGRFLLPAKVSMRHAIGQVAVHRRPVWADRSARDAGIELRVTCELLALHALADESP